MPVEGSSSPAGAGPGRTDPEPTLSRRIVGAALVVAVLVVGVGAAAAALSVREAAGRAMSAARTAASVADAGDFATVAAAAGEAAAATADARDAASSPFLGALRWVPVVGDEVRTVRHVVAAADLLAVSAADVADLAGIEVYTAGRLHPEGTATLAGLLADAAPRIADARRELAAAGPSRIGQVEEARLLLGDLTATLGDVVAGFEPLVSDLADASAGGEPVEVLVVFENGAELRATGGLPGFTALLTVDGDGVGLGRVDVVHSLGPRTPDGGYVAVDAPADYLARYGGFLANTTLWLNVNLSPHFPSVAEVAGRLYTLATGVDPDLVVRVDLTGLGYVLGALPAVSVDGAALDPATLATAFILDSYLRFPDPVEQNAYLARVVGAVVAGALDAEHLDGRAVLAAGRRAVTERRLAVWSGDPATERAFAALGADGALPPGDPGQVDVAVENFAANKIDLFTGTAIAFEPEATGCLVTTTASVTLTNAVPALAAVLPAGVLETNGRWWVNVFLPAEARVLAVTIDGALAPASVAREQSRPVAAVLADAPPGRSVTVAVRFQELASGSGYRLRSAPQARVHPASLVVAGREEEAFTGAVEFPVDGVCEGIDDAA